MPLKEDRLLYIPIQTALSTPVHRLHRSSQIKGMKDKRTYKIIGCAMEVHKELGHGFLEAVYQEALAREFDDQGVPYQSPPPLGITYKGKVLGKAYQPDYLCYGGVVVEIKALSSLSGTEEAQIINYLKAARLRVGLLLNFGAKSLEYRRFVFDL